MRSLLPTTAARELPVLRDRVNALALALAPGIGPVRWADVLRRCEGDAERALALSVSDGAARATLVRLAAETLARAETSALRTVLRGDPEYPPTLADLADPPPALWMRGAHDWADPAPLVAIVGTRAPSGGGVRSTRALAAALARAGATVVSGMALGVDAVAHEAALDAGGRSIAVLGTGADVAYPASHRRLHARLAEQGLVLSEQPPGAPPRQGAFPRRNRLIAALAHVTIVAEAGVRSGALITAADALELGRTVAALPGPIDLPNAAGTNALLRDGAQVLATVDDALALAGLAAPRLAPESHRDAGPRARRAAIPAGVAAADTAPTGLGDDERAVWSALAQPAADPDELTARSRLPVRRCIAALTALELAGLVECRWTGEIARR